jgi:hypothetical protein
MTQAPPAVFKIPTESPQPAPGKAAKPSGRAKKAPLPGPDRGPREGERPSRGHPGRRRGHRAGVRDHGLPGPLRRSPLPADAPHVFPVRETVTAVAPGDGTSLESESAHEPSCAGCAAAQVHGPGPAGPDGTDQANQPGGPVRHSAGPLGAGGPTAPARTAVTAPAGDVNAAAVAAYRASVQEGKPLSERKLAEAFGKTSRRWARARMTEARPGSVAC